MEGFLHYQFGGLTFGGAYTWRGLFLGFYGISMLPTPSLVPSYSLLPRFTYISPVRVQKLYSEPFFNSHVIHVITNLGIGQDLFMKQLHTKPDLATLRLQYVTYRYVNIGSGTQKEVHFIPLGEGGWRLRNKGLFQSLTVNIPFLTKCTPFIYLPLKNCTLFTRLIHKNKSVRKEVFRSFS